MKSKLILSVVILASLFASIVSAQTAEEIIAKAIQAQGGEAALKAINSVKTSGTFEIPQLGMTMQYVEYNKRPNKMRMEINMHGMIMIQATDGEKAWMVDPGGGSMDPTEISDRQIIKIYILSRGDLHKGNLDGFYFNLKERGIKPEFIGKEEVAGEELNHVKFTYEEDGFEISGYFDPANGLLRMIPYTMIDPQTGGEVDSQLYFSDYRQFGDVLMAYTVEMNMGPQNTVITVENYEFNTEIDDSIFTMPEPEGETEEPEKQ